MSRCPYPGCPAETLRSKLACREHWFLLPKSIRDAVWDGWWNRAEWGLRPWMEAFQAARAFWKDHAGGQA